MAVSISSQSCLKTRSERKPIIVELSIGQSIFGMLQWETAVLAGQQIAKRPRIFDSLHHINSCDGSGGGGQGAT